MYAIELAYVFNNPQEDIYTGNKYNYELADEVQQMWVNFARNGNPSTSKHVWEQYNSVTRKSMIFDENIQMVEDYKKEQRILIEPLLKYYFSGCYSDLSLNVPQFYKIIAQIVGAILLLIAIIIVLEIVILILIRKIKKEKENKKEENIKEVNNAKELFNVNNEKNENIEEEKNKYDDNKEKNVIFVDNEN